MSDETYNEWNVTSPSVTGWSDTSDDNQSDVHVDDNNDVIIDVDADVDNKGEHDLPTLSDILEQNVSDQVHLTDRGNGRRFVDLFQHIAKYVIDLDEWIIRDGVHWKLDKGKLNVFGLTAGVTRNIRLEALSIAGDDPDVRDAMLAYATKTESEQLRWRMLNSAREHQDEIVIAEDDMDHDYDLVATPKGVINMITGEWRPAKSSDLCTAHTCVEFDADATSPLLKQYLDTFVPDPDDQEVLFAILGTIIRGGNPTRIFPIFLGGTTSGKSQLLAALNKLFGDYICSINASVFRGNMDDKPRPDLVRAMNKRVAVAIEASKSWELHSDQIKRITGGTDPIPYRNLYGQSQEKIPRFTPLVVTNEMPRIKGADAALRRRLLTFHFDQTLPPELEDTSIKDKFINDERCQQALLARIVEGAQSDMMRNGVKWTMLPEKYATSTMDSFNQLDHINEFIEWLTDREILVRVDMTEVAVSHCARANELHEWYVLWIQKHGNKQDKSEILSMKEFGVALRDRGWVSKLSAGTRWLGFRLTSTATMPSVWTA